jgi:hypothetical protein
MVVRQYSLLGKGPDPTLHHRVARPGEPRRLALRARRVARVVEDRAAQPFSAGRALLAGGIGIAIWCMVQRLAKLELMAALICLPLAPDMAFCRRSKAWSSQLLTMKRRKIPRHRSDRGPARRRTRTSVLRADPMPRRPGATAGGRAARSSIFHAYRRDRGSWSRAFRRDCPGRASCIDAASTSTIRTSSASAEPEQRVISGGPSTRRDSHRGGAGLQHQVMMLRRLQSDGW